MMWEDIVGNLIADFLFVVIAIGIGWVIFIFTKRTRLLKFFGIGDNRRLVIYLSDLRLKSGDTFGIDDKRRSYTGSAVAFGEMQSANRFRDLLNYFLPSLSETPGFLSKLLISDVQTQMLRSPSSEEKIEQSASFITLGSPAYNNASGFVEERLHSRARFVSGTTRLPFPDEPVKSVGVLNTDDARSSSPTGSIVQEETKFTSAGSVAEVANIPSSHLPSGNKVSEHPFRSMKPVTPLESPTSITVEGIPPLTESTYGFVERLVDHEHKRSVFYVAGISELATVGAANFLISEWEKLQRKHGNDKNFLVMLRFESTDSRRWTVVFEK